MFEIPVGLRTVVPSGGFFDWASLSPSSSAAADARRSALEAAISEVDAPEHVRRETVAVDLLRQSIIDFVGARGSAPAVVIGRSVSEFMSVLAFGLSRESRSTVSIVGSPHPSVVIAWRAAAQALGGDVRLRAADDTDAYDERTLAVIATHVDHLFGIEQPLGPVVEAAARVGAISVIDGAQAVGRVRLNLDEAKPDIYIGSGRKALLAPLGTAFMSIKPDVLESVAPAIWSTRSGEFLPDGSARAVVGPRRLEGNLPDLGALAGFRASINLFTPHVVAQLRDHVNRLLPTLTSSMEAAGLTSINLASDNLSVGIASFRLPDHVDGVGLQHQLKRADLVLAATHSELRISLHFANTPTDVARLSEEVARHAA